MHAVGLGHLRRPLAEAHGVLMEGRPAATHRRRGGGAGLGGHPEGVVPARRGEAPAQGGVEGGELVDAHPLQPPREGLEIHAARRRHHCGGPGGLGPDLIEAEPLGVTPHDDGGHDLGHVAGGLQGQRAAIDQGPEVVGVGGGDGPGDGAGAGVVRRQRQGPRAELIAELEQVAGGGAGGSLKVPALVQPVVHLEIEAGRRGGGELPRPRGARGARGLWIKAALDHADVDQGRRGALVFEPADDLVMVAAHPGVPRRQAGLAPARELLNVGRDVGVDGDAEGGAAEIGQRAPGPGRRQGPPTLLGPPPAGEGVLSVEQLEIAAVRIDAARGADVGEGGLQLRHEGRSCPGRRAAQEAAEEGARPRMFDQ